MKQVHWTIPQEVTREELFTQVWERPMTKVAADYCISDVAMKKTCDKHRIPVPGRGYWAKKAAGKPVQKALFRKVSDPTVERISIYGSGLKDLPEPVLAARKEAKQRERLPENRIDVPTTTELGELHPKVAQTHKKLQRGKPDHYGMVTARGEGFFEVTVGPDSVVRVSAFLHSLVTAAKERGFKIAKGERALAFVVDGETIDVKVTEQVTHTKHIATDAEVEALRIWEARQAPRVQSWSGYGWTPRPTPPEWDHAPSGVVRLQINEGKYGYNGLRKSFGDGKTQRIETLINAILGALSTWSAAIKAERAARERRQQEWQEAKRLEEERRRITALEKKRVEALEQNLERRRRHKEVLEFIAVVEGKLRDSGYDDQGSVHEWIEWAKGYAERLDPIGRGLPRLLQVDDFGSWELR